MTKDTGPYLRCPPPLIASLPRRPGFKKTTKDGIKMDAGIPATVNLALEVGAVTETVEVTGAAEIVESATATVSSDLTGRQVNDLPIPSRNATDLIVTLPGTQTPAGPRNTTFDGLPQATVNMTLDGVNIQDNLLKNGSGGAFYPVVYPRTDAVEEVSVTTRRLGRRELGRRRHPGKVRDQVRHQPVARRRVPAGAQYLLRRQHLLQQHRWPAARPHPAASDGRAHRRSDHEEQALHLFQLRNLPLPAIVE